MFVTDGRECLRRGFRARIHSESRKAEGQFTLRRNTPQISCHELPLADPGQEAIWHSFIILVGETAVKASSIDRKFGLSKLCKRLGEYEEGEYPATCPKLAPEPLSPVCEEE